MDKHVIVTIGNVPVHGFVGASPFFFRSGLAIDADGSPRAYGPDGQGLDYLANAGHPGNWWALVTDTGKPSGTPIVQGQNDAAPGFYVSMTALENRSAPATSPKRYVDSETVPYIVLPGHHATQLSPKLRLGDLALVTNGKTGVFSYAIYADIGPSYKIGEGSIALGRALHVAANPKHGNGARDIVYLVFPGTGNGRPKAAQEIQSAGRLAFQAWGGFKRLAVCLPEYAAVWSKL
jgi:hypothetical protein